MGDLNVCVLENQEWKEYYIEN